MKIKHNLIIYVFIVIFSFSCIGCSNNTENHSGQDQVQPQVRGEHEITPPEIAFDFLEFYRPMLGKVVFVKKKIYGGDMEYNCILRGRVKNLTNLPFENICILWYFWDSADNLIEISPTSYYNPPPQYWLDQINYLDSRSEVDFGINLDIQQMSPVDGNAIKQAVMSGRNEAYIAIPN